MTIFELSTPLPQLESNNEAIPKETMPIELNPVFFILIILLMEI
jgi:hypothetical protein